MKKLIVVLFLSIITHGLFAQEYAFKVLVNKGRNEVKVGNTWQALKVGLSLSKNDELKIAENSYVGLVHATGKPLELKSAEKIKVADLLVRIKNDKSVVTKYTDFILSSNSKPKTNLNATGAVHRGPKDIPIYIPVPNELAVVYGPTLIINWNAEDLKGPFIVTVNTLFGDELLKTETKEDHVTIDLNGRDFQKEDNMTIKVVSKTDGKESREQCMIKRLSKSEHERISKLLHAELGDKAGEELPLSKLILAAFFEQQNLLIDAATAHQQAIKLAPEVQQYKDYYNAFLLRTQLKAGPDKK